jgi:beta-lactamase regulating signal transducer with metallopeptidase domain
VNAFSSSHEFDLLLVQILWKATVLLVAILAVGRMLRKKSASLRELAYTTGVFCAFVLLVVLPFFPRWNVTLSRWPAVVSEHQAETNDPMLSAKAPVNGRPETRGSSDYSRLEKAALAAWLVGVAVFAVRILTSLIALRKLRLESSPIPSDSVDILAEHRVTIHVNDRISVPVTWGLVRRVLVLPLRFEELSDYDRSAIYRHELTHLKRNHFVIRLVTEIVCALLWFQPLVWMVRRRLRETQEQVCDDQVLLTGTKPSSYAELLLGWEIGSHEPQLAAALYRSRSFADRLAAILNRSTVRTPARMSHILVLALVGLFVTTPLIALNFRQSAAARESASLRTPILNLLSSDHDARAELNVSLPKKPAPPLGANAATRPADLAYRLNGAIVSDRRSFLSRFPAGQLREGTGTAKTREQVADQSENKTIGGGEIAAPTGRKYIISLDGNDTIKP